MKTTTQFDTDIEGRKHGEQSGLETHVVHAVNDARSSDRSAGNRDIVKEVGKGLMVSGASCWIVGKIAILG